MPSHTPPADPTTAPEPQHEVTGARDEARLDPQALAASRAELALAAGSPWRASLLMARLDGLRARLDRLRGWLLGLTRAQRRTWARRLALASPAALLAVALSAGPPAHAANISVDAGVVVIAADSLCSLREAIINANDDAATHADCAAGGGADTITLTASTFTVPDVDNTTNGENGLPSITTEITIDGNGAIIERAPADPDTFRLFHVAATGDLTLDATTVRYGVADDAGEEEGGGIRNDGGVLAVTNGSVISGNTAAAGGGIFGYGSSTGITGSTVTGNSAEYIGGGVYVEGGSLAITGSTISNNVAAIGGGVATLYTQDVTITGSTISGNSAIAAPIVGGGGILVAFGAATISTSTISGNSAILGGGVDAFVANLDIDHSTISDNSAAYGGGLVSFGFYAPGYGTTTLTNSTISGNSADQVGGGVFNGGLMIIRNATITGNSARYGGGISTGLLVPYGSTYLTNSIVADQVYGGDCYGTVFTSGDFNLDSDGTCGLTGPNDIPGGNANLGPLALNAPGTTETHALLAGSDALDAGDCSGGSVTDDQRTVLRPQGAACDIGAYEFGQAPTPTPPPGPPTAAQLAAFMARQDRSGRVALTWETASEADVAGFNIERAADPSGPWSRVNAALIPAAGGAAGGASYHYVDQAPGLAGPPHYRLEVVGASGPPQTFGPIAALRRLFEAVLPWVGRQGG